MAQSVWKKVKLENEQEKERKEKEKEERGERGIPGEKQPLCGQSVVGVLRRVEESELGGGT